MALPPEQAARFDRHAEEARLEFRANWRTWTALDVASVVSRYVFTITRGVCILRRMWKPAGALPLKPSQRADLEALVRSGKTPQRVAARAAIVLAAGDGKPMNAIAQEFGVSRPNDLGLPKLTCPWAAGTHHVARTVPLEKPYGNTNVAIAVDRSRVPLSTAWTAGKYTTPRSSGDCG